MSLILGTVLALNAGHFIYKEANPSKTTGLFLNATQDLVDAPNLAPVDQALTSDGAVIIVNPSKTTGLFLNKTQDLVDAPNLAPVDQALTSDGAVIIVNPSKTKGLFLNATQDLVDAPNFAPVDQALTSDGAVIVGQSVVHLYCPNSSHPASNNSAVEWKFRQFSNTSHWVNIEVHTDKNALAKYKLEKSNDGHNLLAVYSISMSDAGLYNCSFHDHNGISVSTAFELLVVDSTLKCEASNIGMDQDSIQSPGEVVCPSAIKSQPEYIMVNCSLELRGSPDILWRENYDINVSCSVKFWAFAAALEGPRISIVNGSNKSEYRGIFVAEKREEMNGENVKCLATFNRSGAQQDLNSTWTSAKIRNKLKVKLIETIEVGNQPFGGLTELRGNIVVAGARINVTAISTYSQSLHFYNATTFAEQKVIDLDKINVQQDVNFPQDVDLTSLAGDDATNSIYLRVESCICIWKFADETRTAQKWIPKYTTGLSMTSDGNVLVLVHDFRRNNFSAINVYGPDAVLVKVIPIIGDIKPQYYPHDVIKTFSGRYIVVFNSKRNMTPKLPEMLVLVSADGQMMHSFTTKWDGDNEFDFNSLTTDRMGYIYTADPRHNVILVLDSALNLCKVIDWSDDPNKSVPSGLLYTSATNRLLVTLGTGQLDVYSLQ